MERMQQNIISVPTSKLFFEVQFFAETYFSNFQIVHKNSENKILTKISVIR